MPTYFNNWPQGYEALPDGEVQKSRDAGAAVIRAIAASMRLLLGYESPGEWRPEAAKEAAEHFSKAAALYASLEENAPKRRLLIPSDARRALAGALTCAEVAGGVLLRGSIIDLQILAGAAGQQEQEISGQDLARMARHLTREASNVLPALSLSSGNTAISRRIAADVAVIQIVGVLIARVIYQDHAFSSL